MNSEYESFDGRKKNPANVKIVNKIAFIAGIILKFREILFDAFGTFGVNIYTWKHAKIHPKNGNRIINRVFFSFGSKKIPILI